MAGKLRIRRFCWEDLGPFTRLFNRVNGVDGTPRAADETFMRQFLAHPSMMADHNGFLAERDGSLEGYLLVFMEQPISRSVGMGGAAAGPDEFDVWTSLIHVGLNHARAAEVSVFHTQLPEDARVRRSLLVNEGFSHARTYWNMRWQPRELPYRAPDPGLRFRPLRPGEDEGALAEIQNAAFSANWGFCPNTREQIEARVRFSTMDPQGIIMLELHGRVVGYNWTSLAESVSGPVGRIEMTGVHPDMRGRGLGKVVVSAGLEYMRARGAGRVELEVDSANAAATRLYEGLGFEYDGPTYWYEKRLADSH